MSVEEYVRKILRRVVYRYKSDSESYLEYYRQRGASIGSGCVVYEPTNTMIDVSRPYLISIGNDVQILKGVTILTHGYDWSVLKRKYGDVLGNAKPVAIGNNVFIGRNATIMGGVTIGDNVIIGAGAIVTKDIPSDTVVVGVPARAISTVEEYYKKRSALQVFEAQRMAKAYYKAFHKTPPKEEVREFFWLFEERKKPLDNPVFDDVMKLVSNYDMSYDRFMESKPVFNGYAQFIESCHLQERSDRA